MTCTAAKLRSALTGFALVLLVLGLPLVLTQLAVAAPPPPLDFTVTPQVPLSGQTATFTATGTRPGDVVSWDFENDGTFDATGSTVQHVYAAPGERTVVMRVTKDLDVKEVLKVVRVDAPPNSPPVARFSAAPNPAFVGAAVTFDAGASSDPDGTIARYDWDFDNDGRFDDASGITVTHSFATAGAHTVRVLVTDNRGATDTATLTVNAATASYPLPPRYPQPPGSALPLGPPPTQTPVTELMSPFPVVRLVAKISRRGARVTLLRVSGAPSGARVAVRCRGRRCPRRTKRTKTQFIVSGRARFRSFERRLPARTVLRIRITQPGRIGKYTSFRIRRSRAPLRRDRCLIPGSAAPVACPSS